MEWFLIILGVLCLGLGLLMEHPMFRERITRPWVEREWAREETRVKQARQQVEKAREDVAVLLEELDRASDKVVELMTNWAEQAHAQTARVPSTQVSPAPAPTDQAQAAKVQKAQAAQLPGKPVPIESAKRRRSENPGTGQGKGNHVLKDKYKTVLSLAEQGLSIDDIAQSAQIGKGEVQLLLDLQKRGDKL